MGNYFSEPRILSAAFNYQQATDHHLRRPQEVAPGSTMPFGKSQ